MLGDEDEQIAASVFHGADPLVRVECRGIENRGVLAPRSPFDAVECVGAKVQEESSLEPHPGGLVGARQHFRGFLGDHLARIAGRDDLYCRIVDRSRLRSGARWRLTGGQAAEGEEACGQWKVFCCENGAHCFLGMGVGAIRDDLRC